MLLVISSLFLGYKNCWVVARQSTITTEIEKSVRTNSHRNSSVSEAHNMQEEKSKITNSKRTKNLEKHQNQTRDYYTSKYILFKLALTTFKLDAIRSVEQMMVNHSILIGRSNCLFDLWLCYWWLWHKNARLYKFLTRDLLRDLLRDCLFNLLPGTDIKYS